MIKRSIILFVSVNSKLAEARLYDLVRVCFGTGGARAVQRSEFAADRRANHHRPIG